MTLFRIRRWGSAEWTEIAVTGGAESTESEIALALRLMLSDGSMHAQEATEQGEWEDLA